MKLYYTIILLSCIIVFTTCKKKEDVKTHCQEVYEQLQGTYDITVTSYPLQSTQEGDEKEILVFVSDNCNGTILFNNLFSFFGCTAHPLIENTFFKVKYEDEAKWQGASIKGTGSIINGIFHFEGTVINRGIEYPIILDGQKSTSFMRTSAC